MACVACCAVLGGAPVAAAPVAVAAAALPATGTLPERLAKQEVDWHSCATGPDDDVGAALNGAGARCAEIEVPLDYAAPNGRTIEIALSRIPASNESDRHGVLMLNPGGPGGSGVVMPLVIKKASPSLAARFDLVGMDPRFVGASTPIDCGWPTGSPLRGAGPGERSFRRVSAFAAELAARCASTGAGLLPHASTRNTARDLDAVRTVLDEKTVSYLGYSYGTYLGAVYLQMFPRGVDRIVLDSALDPATYSARLFTDNGQAIIAAQRNWASWTALRHDTYGLGRQGPEVLAAVETLRAATDRRPLTVGGFTVDSSILPLLLWPSDDSDAAYAELSSTVRLLVRASHGAAVTPSATLTQSLELLRTSSLSAFGSAQAAILCADRAVPRDPGIYLADIEAHRRAEPLFGPLTRNLTPCAFWPVRPAEAPTAVRNARPALILNSTGDTQTTHAEATALHRALTGSRMVTLRNAYRHGVYLAGRSTCADKIVETYLLTGALPDGDRTCTTDRATSRMGNPDSLGTSAPGTGSRWSWPVSSGAHPVDQPSSVDSSTVARRTTTRLQAPR
jgi:pimeloyl-ACP methyl ester carboxylesterase